MQFLGRFCLVLCLALKSALERERGVLRFLKLISFTKSTGIGWNLKFAGKS